MPQISLIKKAEIEKAKRFDSEFLIKNNKITKNYENLIEENYFILEDILEFGKPDFFSKGDLVFSNFGIEFKLEIVEKPIENKFRRNLINIKNNTISKEYLLWWFNKKEVQDYISLNSTGNILKNISLSKIKKLKINMPTKFKQNLNCVNITLRSEFKEIVKLYYKEYLNIKDENFFSCCFLSRAICEAILHQFLVDMKIKKKFLEKKMFGQLLEIIEMNNYKIMNFDEFKNIQKYGNLIHPQNANKNFDKIGTYQKEIKKDFDKIIKSFGI